MTAMSTTKLRQPPGAPIGGEFAKRGRPESDVTLNDRSLSAAEILEVAILLSRRAARRNGLTAEDAEDIAQETVYSVLRTRARNKGMAIEGGLIRVASNALVSRLVDTHKRHEDSRAYREWKLAVQGAEQARRRHLTAKELDEIAVEIRENWHSPRHRPHIGFQHETKFVHIDAYSSDFIDSIVSSDHYIADGTHAQNVLADRVEAGEVSKDVVRRQMWNLINQDSNVPESVRGSTTETRARAYARVVGDALAVASARENGDATQAQEEALFAPFGEHVTESEKMAVVHAITSRPSVGHRLWRSALDYSNKKFST